MSDLLSPGKEGEEFDARPYPYVRYLECPGPNLRALYLLFESALLYVLCSRLSGEGLDQDGVEGVSK